MTNAPGSLLAELRAAVTPERVLTTPEDLSVYAFDGTAILRQEPACVVVPDAVEQVAAVLRIASAHATPVVTRGSGTGLAGGSVPCVGAIVLCLVRLNRILEVDEANLTMTVEPGVLTQAVADAAAAAGLFYPPARRPGGLRRDPHQRRGLRLAPEALRPAARRRRGLRRARAGVVAPGARHPRVAR